MEAPITTARPQTRTVNLSTVIGVIAALVAIGAGVALAMTESASAELTVFDAMFKGLGCYMIARGLWMLSSLPGRRRDPA